MRKTFVALALVACCTATTACPANWLQQFESNPIAQVQAFEQGVQVVLSNAQLAWQIVLPYLPAGQVPAITQQFNNAVFAVNHALLAINDAVNVAVAAQNTTPNFATLMASVTDAIGQVIAIIDQYTVAPIVILDGGTAPQAQQAGKAPQSPALFDAHQGLQKLKSHYLPAAPVAVH